MASTDPNSIEEEEQVDREVEPDIDWLSTVSPTAVRGRSVISSLPSRSLTCTSRRTLSFFRGAYFERGAEALGWILARSHAGWTRMDVESS